MLEAIAECQRFVAGMTRHQFGADARTLKAIVWNLMVIGEAARSVPPEIEANYPAIPWATIRGMRNHIAHGYDVIDVDIVWNVVQDRLPLLIPELDRIEREALE
jgi:uncharacterized protein with HEPN domain